MRLGVLLVLVLGLAATAVAAPPRADERHTPGIVEGEEGGEEALEPEEIPPEIVPDPADEEVLVPGAPDPLDGEAPLPPPDTRPPRAGPAEPAAPVEPLSGAP